MTDLKTEIDTDPLGRGYEEAGAANPGPDPMTDLAAADDMNTAYRTRNRTSMTGDEVFQSIDSRADWDALTADDRLLFTAFCGRDSIDPFASANVELVKSVFGNASATVTNLSAARVEPISRAQELRDANPRFPVPVQVGEVATARAA